MADRVPQIPAALTTPSANRGVGLTHDERRRLGLIGRLPPAALTLDQRYDMVSVQEILKYGRTLGVQLGDYDTDHYAGAFGAKGIRVNEMDEFEEGLKQSLTEAGISIIDVAVDYSRNTELFANLHDGVFE